VAVAVPESLEKLRRLDRYEQRALARQRRALREVTFGDKDPRSKHRRQRIEKLS
jgi:hypothetical protein